MRILFVTCTKRNIQDFLSDAPLAVSFKKELNFQSEHKFVDNEYYLPEFDQLNSFYIFTENSLPLGQAYNKVIENEMFQKLYDAFVFVHDDVSIEDKFLYKKLKKAFDVGDIVGLAGAADFEVKVPTLWHLCSKEHAGSVGHYTTDGRAFMTQFGPAPAEVVVIDGLFIGVKTKSLYAANLKFDENIPGFHLYDIDFSVRAHIAGLKLVVWPIWVVHGSPGLFDVKDVGFNECQDYFTKKMEALAKASQAAANTQQE